MPLLQKHVNKKIIYQLEPVTVAKECQHIVDFIRKLVNISITLGKSASVTDCPVDY